MSLLALLLACDDASTSLAPPCTLAAPVPEVEQVAPGDTLRIGVHPLNESFDTAVYVGSLRAEVLGVQREGCEAWDTCLEDEACGECDDCDACGTAARSCEESVRIRVPAVADGEQPVVVYTQYGVTATGYVTVSAAR